MPNKAARECCNYVNGQCRGYGFIHRPGGSVRHYPLGVDGLPSTTEKCREGQPCLAAAGKKCEFFSRCVVSSLKGKI